MWILVMFDLPVRTKLQRKLATAFRKHLLEDGFSMAQFSVYLHPCPSEENADTHITRVIASLPPEGNVRILKFTDKQFGRMFNYRAGEQAALENMPEQLELF